MPNDTPNSERTSEPSRRSVLKHVAVGATASLGFGGVAAASDAHGESMESRETFRAALEDHRDLLADLADRGLLDSADPADITVDLSGELRPDGRERVTVSRLADGRPITELKLVRKTTDGWLTVGVRPEVDDAFAIVGTSERDTNVVESPDSCCDSCLRTYCCEYCAPEANCDCYEYCTTCDCTDPCPES
ncbi:hypothetical protein [Halorussus aquaticus]|uniref:Tat (Twin-arginine translocation) pathway signal sequence n=1 Tax=Halorussus aquaticus TaxID=2953748 RepID=A0ABD5PXR5_9EURY|nr:hypothetical protein [Halorussus aquaticus]